jgi:hypothetical protein
MAPFVLWLAHARARIFSLPSRALPYVLIGLGDDCCALEHYCIWTEADLVVRGAGE